MRARALTIAGSDPSGGAGIQADLKTFHHFGVYGMSALTLVTVQNTVGVTRVELLEPALAVMQIEACVRDIGVDACKTGALGSAAMIEAVAAVAPKVLVVDPVMISKHGAALLVGDAVSVFMRTLLPKATLLTPNLPEAEALLGLEIRTREDMASAARALCQRGAKAVLLKGGHLQSDDASDCLFDGTSVHWLEHKRIVTPHTHGTGCTLSSAITAMLASGRGLLEACTEAKKYVTQAILTAPGLGEGHGPLNHWAIT